jgi:hypothetical protein
LSTDDGFYGSTYRAFPLQGPQGIPGKIGPPGNVIVNGTTRNSVFVAFSVVMTMSQYGPFGQDRVRSDILYVSAHATTVSGRVPKMYFLQ